MKLAVTGTTGRVGQAVAARCEACGFPVQRLSRAELDLSRPLEQLRAAAEALACDCLVHPAAITSLEAAADDPALAMHVNARAPAVLAAACARRGARMIYLSTDYVFGGTEEGLRTEDHPTGPLSAYGCSKLAGEQAVLAACPQALVVRVSWVFGPEKPAFPDTILQRARRGEPLAAVADKWSLPTYTADLADWICRLAAMPQATGIVHACQRGNPASWHDWARATLEIAHETGLLPHLPQVQAVPLALHSGFRARRPVHTAMATDRLAAWIPTPPRPWREALQEYLRSQAGTTRPSQP
jgi:dTDP-4-dehydrorhamnose reductase